MLKSFKLCLAMLLIFVAAAASISYSDGIMQTAGLAADDKDVRLIIDALNVKAIPENFRKASDPIVAADHAPLNLTGLSTLNISGSHQFSEEGLKRIKKSIGDKVEIRVVDLRQESHGFINGNAVSWQNLKNDANIGLTKEQVLLDEAQRLKRIPLNRPIGFSNDPKLTIIPERVESEEEVVERQSMRYERIPVTDGKLPTDDMTDYFIESVREQPQNVWLHFHCEAGVGRTTTFMIMYDMMRNAKSVSAGDIIKRQVLLANLSAKDAQGLYSKERVGFLTAFHQYCADNSDGFKTKWSQFKQARGRSGNATASVAVLMKEYPLGHSFIMP